MESSTLSIMTQTTMGSLIWSTAELLRNDYKKHDYGKIILPFTIARRLDQISATNQQAVNDILREYGQDATESVLTHAAGGPVYNTSGVTFKDIVSDPQNMIQNFVQFVGGLPEVLREIFQRYKFIENLKDLEDKDLLLIITKKFTDFNLSHLDNQQMGIVFEDLIRRFAEDANETAGEHYTPREVIHLMAQVLLTNDNDILSTQGTIRSIYDPAAGTGGMLTISEEYIKRMNPSAKLTLLGQEINDESYAICKADMVIKGYDPSNIAQGNTLSQDHHAGRTFDYILSNPPFGVDWGKVEKQVSDEHKNKGYKGRFGPGIPRKSDGTMLFMMHCLNKLTPNGRMAIVTNGSPLFTGSAGSGESEIRRWMLEEDYVEAIIALPTSMFYNTAIQTYIWILQKEKAPERKGLVQLIDASRLFKKMRKSLGDKRNELGDDDIARIVRAHGQMEQSDISKLIPVKELGYRTITIDRPLKCNFNCSKSRVQLITKIGKRNGDQCKNIGQVLNAQLSDTVFLDRDQFTRAIKETLQKFKLTNSEIGQIVKALSEPDSNGIPYMTKKGPAYDSDLRDTEDVGLDEDIQAFFNREILPQSPDAWINTEVTDAKDDKVGKIGYEIPFNRYFYKYEALPSLQEIDARIRERSARIMDMLKAVVG